MGGIYKQWAYRDFTQACHYAMALWVVVHFGSNAAVEINGSSLFYSSHSSAQGNFSQMCLQGLNERGELQAKLSRDCELSQGSSVSGILTVVWQKACFGDCTFLLF